MKRGQISQTVVIGAIVAIALLLLVLVGYGIMSGKFSSWIDAIKNLFIYRG